VQLDQLLGQGQAQPGAGILPVAELCTGRTRRRSWLEFLGDADPLSWTVIRTTSAWTTARRPTFPLGGELDGI